MFPLSEEHKDALRDPDGQGVIIVDITTYTGEVQRLSLSQYEIKADGYVYSPTFNVEIENTRGDEGLGTQEWEMTADIGKIGWFRDNAENWRTLESRIKIQFVLFSGTGSLPPLFLFEGVGTPNSSNDDSSLSVKYKDSDGVYATQRRWFLSKEDQRSRDPDDSSLDEVNRRPPAESGPIGDD